MNRTIIRNRISIETAGIKNEFEKRMLCILKKKITEKSGESLQFIFSDKKIPLENEIRIYLAIVPGIKTDGFMIEDAKQGIRIASSSERGLLYGIGKFLRTAHYFEGEFQPGEWRGVSSPDKSLRGIYFATHFHNYYHEAPLEEISDYIESLALWGFNTVMVWYDMHHFSSIDDPEAQAMLSRLEHILSSARRLGLSTALAMLGNEGYDGSPENLRADWTKQDGYLQGLGSHYHVELCPNKEGAMEQLLGWKSEVIERLQHVGIDYFVFGPYDQGGCTCHACRPWGGNGYIKVCKAAAKIIRERCPRAKIVLSTWLFEYFIKGEWEGLSAAMEEDSSWVDMIMWDFNTTAGLGTAFRFDEYIRKHGVPGGLPLVGFPEISMFATHPYGGWGANPQPDYLQSIWDQAGDLYCGGFPYSEGIYEDLNKVVCAQLYWNRNAAADDIVKEYIASEFSAAVVDRVFRALKAMQATYVRVPSDERGNPLIWNEPWGERARFLLNDTSGVEEIYSLIMEAEEMLDEKVRSSWRWKMISLRARIDHDLLHNDFRVSDSGEEALQELEAFYYANHASFTTRPATRKAMREFLPI